jgi:hypothetical protein
VAIGNPLRADGRFAALIRQAGRDGDDGVPPGLAACAVHIPSTASPHAQLDHSPVGLADRAWLLSMARKHGVDSTWYRGHVLALLPERAGEALLEPRWLDACTAVVRPPGPLLDPWLAVDLGQGVGRSASAAVVRDRLGVVDVWHSAAAGPAEAAVEVARLARKWRVPPGRISYDRLGPGADFAHHLRRVGVTGAVPYCGAAGASNKGLFPGRRSEAAWSLRCRLNPEWCPDWRDPAVRQPPFHIPPGPWWPRLREELLALEYGHVGVQIVVLRKEDHVARLGRSPDLSDALIQSFVAWPH